MSNMDYCRFRNTLLDLQDCLDALNENGLDDLSIEELPAAKRLIEVAGEIEEYHSELLEY